VIPAEVAAAHALALPAAAAAASGGEPPAAAEKSDGEGDANDSAPPARAPATVTRIMSRHEALALARLADLDLVEVAAAAAPPVARLCDWGREAYARSLSREQAERRRRARARLDTPKELVFTPRIADHDMATKMRQMAGWLASGQRVAMVVRFRRNEDEAAEQAAAYLSARLCGDVAGAEAGAPAKGPRTVTVTVRPAAGAVAAAAAEAAAEAAAAEEAAEGGGRRGGHI
jgi:translation initiation factor IF-3